MPDFYENVAEGVRELRQRLPEYLYRLGITRLDKPFRCLNPAHEDVHPSMQYNPKKNTVHCFSCGASYDTLDLIAIEENLSGKRDFIKAVRIGCAKLGIPLYDSDDKLPMSTDSNLTTYFDKCHKQIGKFNYFTSRGLSQETIERFNLGIDRHFNAGHDIYIKAAIIPTGPSSFVARNTDSGAGPKMRYRKHGKVMIFNLENALSKSNSEPIILTEGEIDALSCIEAGFNAIGLGSTSNAAAFIRYIRDHRPARPVIIAMDNDDNGLAAANKIYRALREMSVSCEIHNLYGKYKDANEALLKNRAQFIKNIQNACQNLIKGNESKDDEDFILSLYRKLSNEDKEKIRKTISALVA